MNSPTVFIVDDDSAFLDSLSVLVSSMGLPTRTYGNPNEFLSSFDPTLPGCVILDVRMPTMSGLAVQEKLSQLPLYPSIIIMTGHADVTTALRAMRQGAIEFLQKTCSETELCEAIQRAIANDAKHRAQHARKTELKALFEQLSNPEMDVLKLVLRGTANKSIATALGVSRRAVEDRRSRMMQKIGVESVPELVRLAIEAGIRES